MAKIDDLRGKYKNVNEQSLQFFNNWDSTSTKKYLEYMLKTWDNRGYDHPGQRQTIVDAVKEFDVLLPYVINKDIYSPAYKSITSLRIEVDRAKERKEESTFVREEHIIVIHETDNYLLLFPKTHQGSLKYGASTKWCTASKANPSAFNSYKRGCLAYLIDKRKGKTENFSKLAFYGDYTLNINEGYQIYKANDNTTSGKDLKNSGWTEDELFEIDVYYRNFIRKMRSVKAAKDEVDKVIGFMIQLNVESFKNNLKILNYTNVELTINLENTINNFVDQFSTINLINI
jgi:hypothetical protein